MNPPITFHAQGVPAPQGSKRHVGGGRMVESSKLLPAWRKAVTQAATQVAPETPLDCPVSVEAHFYLPKPQKPRFNVPAVHPDADKLARAVGDALEAAGVLRNDSRITHWQIHKHYANHNGPGATITIKEHQ